MRQTCEYCGRHFRSLGRHLDKHHAHQPDVCSALVERYTQMPRLHAQNTDPVKGHTQQPHTRSPRAATHTQGSGLPPSGAPHLSMSPLAPSTLMLTPPRGQNAVAVSVLKRSPPTVAVSVPRKGGLRKANKEGREDEEDEDVEVVEVKRPKEEDEVEVVSPPSFRTNAAKDVDVEKEDEDEEEEEDEEENGVMEVDDDSGAEDRDKDLLR